MSTENANKIFAEEFLSDSRDFLKRFNILLEQSLNSYIGMRSKLLIDLLFSAECCLKALILLNSGTSISRKSFFNHNLNNLLSLLSGDDYSFCKEHLNDNLISFSAQNRYMVESQKTFRTNLILNETYYNTIAKHQWFVSVSENIKKIIDYVSDKIGSPIKVVKISDIDIEKIKQINECRVKFKKSINKKTV